MTLSSSSWRFILFVIVLLTIISTTYAGKCVPFQDYREFTKNFAQDLPIRGVQKSICQSVLESTYTHYWVEDDILSKVDLERPDCIGATQLVLDEEIIKLSNIFSARIAPSCQKTLVALFCQYYFPPCEPSNDGNYGGVPTDKPCRDTCKMFKPENLGQNGACKATDIQYLSDMGLDINNPEIAPVFNCDSPVYAAENAECISVHYLMTHPPIGRCERYSGDFCQGILFRDSLVYVPPYFEQEDLENLVWDMSWIFNVLPYSLNPLDEPSRQASYRSLCQNTFQECLEADLPVVDINSPVPKPQKVRKAVPLRPNKQVCDEVREYYANTPYWSFVNDSISVVPGLTMEVFLPPCEGHVYGTHTCILDDKRGIDNFMRDYQFTSYPLSTPNPNVTISAYTYAAGYQQSVSALPYTPCPYPLVVPDQLQFLLDGLVPSDTLFNGRCARPCPTNTRYTETEFRHIIDVTRIMSIIVFICTLLLVVTFNIFQSQRRKDLVYWFLWSYLPIPFVLLIGSNLPNSDGTYDFQCKTNTALEHFTKWPLFQGMVLIYFGLAFFYWWLMNCCDLFMRLILNRHYRRGGRQSHLRNVVMHIFCWGTPLLSLSGLLLGEYIGYDGSLPFAFATPDPNMASPPVDLLWAFVLFPQIFCIVIGFCLVGAVFIMLIRFDMHNPHSEQQQLEQQQLEQQHANGADGKPRQYPEGNTQTSQLTLHVNHPSPQTTQQNPHHREPPQDSDSEDDTLQQRHQNQLKRTTSNTGQQQQQNDPHDKNKDKNKSGETNIQRFYTMMDRRKSLVYKISQSLKMFAFVLMMVVVWILELTYIAPFTQNADIYEAALYQYEMCLVGGVGLTECKLTARLNPRLIELFVASQLAPGLVLFILYFITQTDVLKLWIGLLARHVKYFEFLKEYGKDDDVSTGNFTDDWSTESGSSNGSTHGSDKFSAGSADLLTGGGGGGTRKLNKGGSGTGYNNNNNNNNNTNYSNTSYTQHDVLRVLKKQGNIAYTRSPAGSIVSTNNNPPNLGYSDVNSGSDGINSQIDTQRRKMLFKNQPSNKPVPRVKIHHGYNNNNNNNTSRCDDDVVSNGGIEMVQPTFQRHGSQATDVTYEQLPISPTNGGSDNGVCAGGSGAYFINIHSSAGREEFLASSPVPGDNTFNFASPTPYNVHHHQDNSNPTSPTALATANSELFNKPQLRQLNSWGSIPSDYTSGELIIGEHDEDPAL